MTCEKPTEPIIFTIEFITPLLIGGAGKDSCDPMSLGKALRGAWRFWFRGVCGGMLDGDQQSLIKALHHLEKDVFGNTQSSIFRMRVEPHGKIPQAKFPRSPHKIEGGKAFRSGLVAGSKFDVTILPRKGMLEEAQRALKVAIWLWGNLGSAGNRSRRGFGSPILSVTPGSDQFSELPMPDTSKFKTREALVRHLKTGINVSLTEIRKFIKGADLAPTGVKIPATALATSANFFVLRDERQVMLSDTSFTALFTPEELNWNQHAAVPVGLINKVHGTSNNNEIGRADPREASPVYVRVHQVKNDDGLVYYPVVTWSQQNHIPQGSSPNTALDYIKTGVGCRTNLSGSAL